MGAKLGAIETVVNEKKKRKSRMDDIMGTIRQSRGAKKKKKPKK